MTERPHSRYTRERTWAALHNQHINACYALVPYSATNNSIAVIRCQSIEETQSLMRDLLKHADECREFYATKQTQEQAPPIIKKAGHAVVLAKSSDYYHYHLGDYTEFRLVICGLHDSYLHIPVWEMITNKRYEPRETSVALSSPDFLRIRCTQYGHNILVGALINGDATALSVLKHIHPRTQRRLRQEAREIQHNRYRGRPLAFLTDAEREAIGSKISEGLKRYHASKHLQVVP